MVVKVYGIGKNDPTLDIGFAKITFKKFGLMDRIRFAKAIRISMEKYYKLSPSKCDHIIITKGSTDYVLVMNARCCEFRLPDKVTESIDNFISVIKSVNKIVHIAIWFDSENEKVKNYITSQIKDDGICFNK